MPKDIASPGDSTAKVPDQHSDQAHALSVYANALVPHNDRLVATGVSSLPSLQLVDVSSAATAKDNPGILSRLAHGTGGVLEAVAIGAYESGAKTYHSAVNAGSSVLNGIGDAYDNRAQVARAIGTGLQGAADWAVSAAQHPGDSIVQAGTAVGALAETVGSGLEAGGSAVLNGVVSTGKWIGNHKLETTAMVGALAVEVVSVGTATPVLAGLGALGAAGTVYGTYSLADHLNEHAADISVLANTDSSSQQREQSFKAIASATGGDAIGLAGAVTGMGAAKLLGVIRGAAPAAEALDASKPVEHAARPAIATGEAAKHANTATTAATVDQPLEVHDPEKTASTGPNHTDAVNETTKPVTPEVQQGVDASGRPLSDGNAERVALQHQPLSDAEMKAQRAAVESDLAGHNGAGGQTILEQFNNSNLSPSQKDRVLNVLAETRSSYMKPGADGQVNPEQLNSYKHTLGELKAGLESAKTNGLTSAETQDALLAGMLSDSHKAGWSASTGGNFFTHHLDGALAADTILGRQMGDGFTKADLKAVQRAILEHQISPPTFMANAYTAEIRAGMKRAGVLPSASDEQSMANIRQMMSNPLTAAQESDGHGGFQLKYSAQERELLQKYVGEGAQNWYVPAQAGSEIPVPPGGLDVGKISAVTRTADIDDNYSAETNADGKAIRGPFKIAGMRGPREMPPDLSLDAATEALRNNMRQSESLLTDADKARLASPERNAAADAVYEQAKSKVGDWLTQQLGHPPDANTPYWGKPLQAPVPGSTPQAVKDWLATPDVKLGQEIQQKFAQELYEMRRTK